MAPGNTAATDRTREIPPDNELGVLVDVTGVLNRSDDIVIALTATRVNSRGVGFELALRRRTPSPIQIGSYGFGRPQTGGSSAGAFLLGFEWSDGSISSNMPLDHGGGLHHGGGGGSNRGAGQLLYLDHLPPAGVFTVITAWPYFALPEHQVTFDADVIRAAAARVEQLWDHVIDDQPPVTRTREERRAQNEAAVLVMPRTGWFGRHFDPTPPPPPVDEHGIEMQFHAFTVDPDGQHQPVRAQLPGWRLADG